MSQFWRAKVSLPGGYDLSPSNIPGNLRKMAPLVFLTASAMLLRDAVAQSFSQEATPECEVAFEGFKTSHASKGEMAGYAVLRDMIRVGCIHLLNQVTGAPLSVADDYGVCSDEENCVRFSESGGMDVVVNGRRP